MKKFALITILILLAAGWLVWRGSGRTEAAEPQRKILYYVDPMHPVYRSDKPGIAPDCGMKLVPVYADEAPAGAKAPAGSVHITAEKRQLIGVQYGEVTERRMTHTIRTVGKLAYDETRMARIHSKIDGWIDHVTVDFTGKLVKKGEPLLTLYSQELLATQQEFLLAARARQQLAGSGYGDAAGGGRALYESARKRLQLFDVSDEMIREIETKGVPQKNITLYAPITGFVIARNAYPSQRVTSETELYKIGDLSVIWVLADAYEYEAAGIKTGQAATMTLTYFPGRKFRGQVSYIYPELDPMTRTLKIRLEFPNPDYALHPEMFANVELTANLGVRLAVPEGAVLDAGAARTVFVDRGDGYLEPRSVELGEKVDGWYAVLKGLKKGERVVTSGNFLIDSESRLRNPVAAPAPETRSPSPAGPKPAPAEHRHD